jgi:hypothetical protein
LNIIPFRIFPLCSNASLPLPLPLLEALFEGCLWYRFQVICGIVDDVFHSLESFLRVILSVGNKKIRMGEVR